ncbi:MAG: LysR family transcriptional regulator [Phenylobacterium sp.]|nr:MAG: LysR family transcriptional regulator [Phenylobacterium sp.]
MTLGVKRLPSFFALRALEAAVRCRSYSAAARELAVTQGAVSQQIRKLEAELGAQLFKRQGNEMLPTPQAQRLAVEVAAAVGRLHAAVDEFAVAAAPEPLVLSINTAFANRWLAPKLPRLLADPAGASLDVRVEDRVANFTTDGVDIGVRFGRGGWDGLETARLTADQFYVVCTPALAAAQRIAALADLTRAPLIHSTDRLWPLFFDRYGLKGAPTPGPAFNDSVLTLDAVARGLGVALVRSSMVEDDLRAGHLVRPIPETMPLPVNFVKPGRLVRPVAEGDPPPADLGYFVAWRADSRKLRRIALLRDWLLAEAQAAEADAADPRQAVVSG